MYAIMRRYDIWVGNCILRVGSSPVFVYFSHKSKVKRVWRVALEAKSYV
jgi:hypothetical protein